jgi:hypothetical protein
MFVGQIFVQKCTKNCPNHCKKGGYKTAQFHYLLLDSYTMLLFFVQLMKHTCSIMTKIKASEPQIMLKQLTIYGQRAVKFGLMKRNTALQVTDRI